MQIAHAFAAHWSGGFDESALGDWARKARKELGASRASLGLVFMSPSYFAHAQAVLEILRVHAQIPLLAGCSSGGLIAGNLEIEEQAGLVLGLYNLPGASLKACRITAEQVEEANGPGYWHLETEVGPEDSQGWLAFLDPFHMDCESWVQGWNEAYPGRPVLGGLASGESNEQRTQVYLNGEVYETGGVAISFGGDVELSGVISQGCTPIGETWTITKADRNFIYEIGNRRAYEVLLETYQQLSAEDQQKTRGNVLVGLVINEYLEEFHRGDFLVRSLLGADPRSGIIAVGATPRQGQTMQFQRRDAAAATEDMLALLKRAREQLGGRTVYGGCLCCCNGRGQRMFGAAHHDAQLVQNQLGSLGLTGFFCNGEIGPVGERNFLHGYTASLALFVKKAS
jgi:small ligand-binding sensory domain FIST